jgi:hypothetical protein
MEMVLAHERNGSERYPETAWKARTRGFSEEEEQNVTE